MTIRARVHGVRLSTLLESVADRGYQNYGFDTLGEGTVNIDWTGAADDLTVAAKLAMSAPQSSAAGLLPLNGSVDAKYFQQGGRVQIYQLEAHSPGTTLNTTGSLGVYPIEEPSNPDTSNRASRASYRPALRRSRREWLALETL